MNTKQKILYVDDEELNLLLFNLNFNKKYDVVIAGSGATALDLLDEHKDISIVISDMKMPVMSGIEFIQQAKVKYPDIKYYILTGYDITVDIQKALDSRLIEKYFRKPFDIHEINDEILAVLKI